MILWAGKSSDDARVIVEYYPNRPMPARQIETVSVPGRNGALLFDKGAYENYIQRYDIYISAEKPGLPRVARGAAAWLSGPVGYQRLEDSYDPDAFSLAYYAGPVDVESILNTFGRAAIEFNCKPQRFLKQGERALALNESGEIYNPSPFPALPVITVYGGGSGTLNVNGYTAKLNEIDEYVTLDSDVQNAYKGTLNKNNTVSISDFPVLSGGTNEISWSGGVTGIEIVPRWWTL